MSASCAFRRQYIAMACVLLALLALLSSRPADLCSSSTNSVLLPHKTTKEPPSSSHPSPLPTIYAITPTYARLAQKADLTRLSQTLSLVKDFHWIVIEDSTTKTPLVTNLLRSSKLNYTHLNAKTIRDKKSTASGVEQRNAALSWLRDTLAEAEDRRGVVYFMDDDNTYSLQVFDEMRKIRKVGIWPVGLVGGMRVEMPLVRGGRVTGFNAVWKPFRPFPIDMAGFAINATLLLDHPEAKFSRSVQSGYQESEILKYVVTIDELEPLAEDCTKVYVWHTRTQKPSLIPEHKIKVKPPSDAHIEV